MVVSPPWGLLEEAVDVVSDLLQQPLVQIGAKREVTNGYVVDGDRSHLQEDDVGVMALYDFADRPYPSVHRDVLAGPDIVRQELAGERNVIQTGYSISASVD